MSTPGRGPRSRPRAGLAVQLGQTLLVLGVLVVLAGLLLHGGPYAVTIGAVLAVAGLVLLLVGLRRRGESTPPA